MTDWASLQHAYGPAEDVPELLRAAEQAARDDGPEWNMAWGCLCHQGTVYTASYAALPLLTEIAERHAPAGYVAAIHLAAAIVASTDGPSDSAVVRHQYARELQQLRDLAERSLALAESDVGFIYGLQALMAFEDGDVWQRNLDFLADGELSLECPNCGEYLLVNLDDSEYAMTNASDSSVTPTPVSPQDPSGSTVGARMLNLAHRHGRTDFAAQLPYLFGAGNCPSCHEAFEVPGALT